MADVIGIRCDCYFMRSTTEYMIDDFILNFLDELRYHKNYSKLTINSYHVDLNQLNVFIGDKNICEVSRLDIIAWIKKLHAKELSSKTLQRKLSSVRSFFVYLIKNNTITSNPSANIKAPKDSKKLPNLISVDELVYLLDIKPNGDIEVRDIIIFDLLYSCGIRLGELSAIKLTDINHSENTICVTGKGNKQRIVFFGDKTSTNIDKWI